MRPPLIAYSDVPWRVGWSSRHRLIAGLAGREWPTVFTSGALSLSKIGNPDWVAAPLLGRTEAVPPLIIDRPGRLAARSFGVPTWDQMALARHARRMRALFARDDGGALCSLVFHPRFWPYVERLNPSRLIYFVFDAHSLTPAWTPWLAANERELVRRADLIVGFSRGMLDLLPDDGPTRARELPTGVDAPRFEAADASTVPVDLAAVPSPRIGYVGRINQKLDIDLVARLADADTSRHWVFIGPLTGVDDNAAFLLSWRAALARPNIHHLGAKPHEEVPAYMRHMDVNIMCYRDAGGWWKHCHPLKMHEYLAAGRPVVSSSLATVMAFREVIDIVSNDTEWMRAIDRALTSGGIGDPASRRAVARANSWESRVDELDRWMLDIV